MSTPRVFDQLVRSCSKIPARASGYPRRATGILRREVARLGLEDYLQSRPDEDFILINEPEDIATSRRGLPTLLPDQARRLCRAVFRQFAQEFCTTPSTDALSGDVTLRHFAYEVL